LIQISNQSCGVAIGIFRNVTRKVKLFKNNAANRPLP